MKILITGANGFIGQHLVAKLSRSYTVIATDLKELVTKDKKIQSLDLLDPKAVLDFFINNPIDTIVHLAAKVPPSFQSPEAEESYAVNMSMTKNLLEAFKQQKVKQFIYISGISVLGEEIPTEITETTLPNPSNPYTQGKLDGETLAQKYANSNQTVTILRVSAPYGAGQSPHTVMSKFIDKAQKNENLIIFGSGNRAQDFIYIDDVCEAIECAVKATKSGVYNIANGNTTTVKDLAQLILKLLPDSQAKIVFEGEDAQENYRPEINTKKAENELKFKAKTNLKNGLKEIIKNY